MNLDSFKTKFAMLNQDNTSLQRQKEDEDNLKKATLLFETFKVVIKRDLKDAVIQYYKITPTNQQLDTEIESILNDVFKDNESLGLIVQFGTKEFINYLLISNSLKG